MKRVSLKRSLVLFSFIMLSWQLLFMGSSIAGNPENISINPVSGASTAGQTFTFTTTYSDSDGAGDIAMVAVWFATQIPHSSRVKESFHGTVKKEGNAYKYYGVRFTNKMGNNDTTDYRNYEWDVGGYVIGSPNKIHIYKNSNTDSVLDDGSGNVTASWRATYVQAQGNTLTVTWEVSLKNFFANVNLNTYLFVQDKAGNCEVGYWKQLGNWKVDGILAPQIILSPDKPVYRGDETITITVVGSPDTQRIDLYWKSAYLPMNLGGAGEERNNFHPITGTYNPATHTLTAQWSPPKDNQGKGIPQEILLVANNFGSNGAWISSGNPALLEPNFKNKKFPNLPYESGHQKMIFVDPLIDLDASNAIDLKDYLKIEPGNYWEYEGTNYTYPEGDTNRSFTSRIEIEQPTVMCGHKTIGMRFLKDKISGYWGTVYSYQYQTRWCGLYGLRWVLSYFESDSRWSNRFSGSLWGIVYDLLNPPDQFKGLGSYGISYFEKAKVYFTSGSQHFYYAPYLFAPRYLPYDWSWSFIREDGIYDFEPLQENDAWKFENSDEYNNNYTNMLGSHPWNRGHGWENMFGWEDVDTPLYKGRALRIIFLEYDISYKDDGEPSGRPPGSDFLLREDWFFAKDIGLVMIRQKNLNAGGKPEPTYNRETAGSQCNNIPMQEPELEMKLIKYYAGGALEVSSPNSVVKPGTSWSLRFSQNYTGYLDFTVDEYLLDGTTKTESGYWAGAWIQDGVINAPIPANMKQGRYVYKFRRHLPDLPDNIRAKGEAIDSSFVNSLPWSNPITVDFIDDTTPPTTPVVTDEGQTTTRKDQLYASWTASDPESGITEYQYRITQDSTNGTVVRNWTSTGTQAYITAGGLNLTPGKTYYFSVKAKNGAGLWSNAGYSDGITYQTSPAAPSNLSATALSSSQINLSWTDNANNETGFKIERKTGAGGTWAEITTVGANTTSYSNTGLKSKTTYYYRIRAYNSTGNSNYSNTAQATTNKPQPTNKPPVARITATPRSGYSSLRVQLKADRSYDPDGSIVSYRWNFGDRGSSEDINPAHVYKNTTKQTKTYRVTLTVTDNQGATSSATTTIRVLPGRR